MLALLAMLANLPGPLALPGTQPAVVIAVKPIAEELAALLAPFVQALRTVLAALRQALSQGSASRLPLGLVERTAAVLVEPAAPFLPGGQVMAFPR